MRSVVARSSGKVDSADARYSSRNSDSSEPCASRSGKRFRRIVDRLQPGNLSCASRMANDPEAQLESLPREELIERARALQTVLRVVQAISNARSVDELA